MVRAPCCEKMGLKKGPWTTEEDQILVSYVRLYGHANWRALPKQAGLLRCGKSCRLRWMNYLRPDIKRGNFTREEEDMIVHWHELLGNRWSAIAARLPGRTDNEIKNVWHTHLKKRALQAAQQPRKKKLRRTAHARAYDDVGGCKPIPTLRVDPVAAAAAATAAYNTRPYDLEEYYPSMVAAPSPISQSCSEFSSTAADHPASNVTGETPAGSSVRNEEYNTESSSELFLCMDDDFWSEAMALPLDGESVASLCLTAESPFTPCNNTCAAGGGSFRTDASSIGAPEHDVDFWLSVLTEVGGGGSPEWPISSF